MAKEHNVDAIFITENKKSNLKSISDVNLGYISQETLLETGFISSKFFIINFVYKQVVKQKFK